MKWINFTLIVQSVGTRRHDQRPQMTASSWRTSSQNTPKRPWQHPALELGIETNAMSIKRMCNHSRLYLVHLYTKLTYSTEANSTQTANHRTPMVLHDKAPCHSSAPGLAQCLQLACGQPLLLWLLLLHPAYMICCNDEIALEVLQIQQVKYLHTTISKVSEPHMIFLALHPLLLSYKKIAISARWLINHSHSHFNIFGAHISILFIIKVKILELNKWSHKFP